MKKLKLKQSNLIAIIIIVVITIAFVVMVPLYIKHNEGNKGLYEEKKIRIIIGDDVTEYSFDELIEYSPSVEFTAVYKPNNMLPIQRTYSGIYLYDLLIALDVNLNDYTGAVFKASDGFQKAYTINEIMQADNVYIAYLVNGKEFNRGIDTLAYTKPEEDGGPFVVIKALDSTSQNRVKMLVEIKLI